MKKVTTKKATSNGPRDGKASRLPPIAMRRLTALLSWLGQGGVVEPTIADAVHLDAYAADLADGTAGSEHWPTYERIARSVAAALVAPPTPPAVVHAQRVDWTGGAGVA